MTKMLLQQKLASATPSTANPTNSTSTKNNINNTANNSNNNSNGTDDPTNNTPTVTDVDTPPTQEKTSSSFSSSDSVVAKGVFGAFLRMTGFADTTPGFEDFQEGSVECALLAPRFSDYDTLTETMKYLLPHGVLQPSPMVSDMLESWVHQWCDNGSTTWSCMSCGRTCTSITNDCFCSLL